MTALLFPSDIDLSVITRENANNVLDYFGHGGYPGGGFFTALMKCVGSADNFNRRRLMRAFPGEVLAAVIALEIEDGIAVLREIANRDVAS